MSANRGEAPTVAILGASGLIGFGLAVALRARGHAVRAIARSFVPAQAHALGEAAVVLPVAAADADALCLLLDSRRIDIVVNCIGVLQEGGPDGTDAVHRGFVERLLEAMARREHPTLLVQISVPGDAREDTTGFSRSKRQAEQAIAASKLPHVILRPGFVVAPGAYGGSALVRALATLPFALPRRESSRPFAVTARDDLVATICVLADRWQSGVRAWSATWEVLEAPPATLGEGIEAFRRCVGGPRPRLTLPSWLLDLGAVAGDCTAHLGWQPPVRTTTLREMRRGVAGDPSSWTAATGLAPTGLAGALARCDATVQEAWFSRLYLLKPVVVAVLVAFWAISGLVPLTVAFDDARALLVGQGFTAAQALTVTVAGSLADLAVAVLIAGARSHRIGLFVGIVVALGYMAGAAVAAPALWFEPLGALVKTGPAIVLMLVAWAIAPRR